MTINETSIKNPENENKFFKFAKNITVHMHIQFQLCVSFKKADLIPFGFIGSLFTCV